MKGISRVSKELDIETHLLRDWEKRNWLGEVIKDPEQNNQRVYDDEQIERIKFIWLIIQEQRKKGLKRTDIKEVEEKLTDKFGGMIEPLQSNMTVPPRSAEQIIELIQTQNSKIAHLESIILQQQAQIPSNLEEYNNIQKELEEAKKREEKQAETIDNMEQKIQESINLISEMKKEQKEKKKSFWHRIFGKE